jgi:hypothetical protein
MPAPTPTNTLFAHGDKGTITVNGTIYYIKTFEWEQKLDKHDVTQSPNNGKRQYQTGLGDCPFSGSALLNLTAAGGSPVTLMQTGSLVTVNYKPDGTVTYFNSALCVIDDVKYSSPTNDQITVTFTGNSGNDYTAS